MNTKRPADVNTYDTRAHAHRVPAPPKMVGCTGDRQSCKWRDEGGGGGKLAQDSAGKHCCAASSTECAVGSRGGWRLTKSSGGGGDDGHVSKDRWDPWESWIMAAGEGREASEIDGEKADWLPM